MDFAGAVTWGHRPEGMLQSIVAEILVWMFSGFLGVFFVLLINVISSRNIILKGFLFGVLYWFLIYAFVTAFKVDGLYPVGFQTATIQLLGGIVFSTVTAKMYVYLAEKYGHGEQQAGTSQAKNQSITSLAQPAMKPLSREKHNQDNRNQK